VWAAGCNAISGLDDLVPVVYADAAAGRKDVAEASPLPGPSDAHLHDFDAIDLRDAAPTPLGDAGVVDANSGLCVGLTLLARFDGTTTTAQGDAPKQHTGVQFAAGKFGQALAATGATQVDYDAKQGTVASSSEGTASMWIKSDWGFPCNNPHLFFGIDDTGVYTDCEPPGYLGVYVDFSAKTGIGASIPPVSGQATWTTSWNHLVATWSRGAPALTITLNGAVGQSTTATWTPPDAIANIIHVSSSGTSPGATLDDVAVWTRPLSAAEIQTIYLAGTSVGDVCKLK
jgi:hypothetical protein